MKKAGTAVKNNKKWALLGVKCKTIISVIFRPAPKNEDEMMIAIFECIDRLFRIVRPRKLLYMAIDGVVSKNFYHLNY